MVFPVNETQAQVFGTEQPVDNTDYFALFLAATSIVSFILSKVMGKDELPLGSLAGRVDKAVPETGQR